MTCVDLFLNVGNQNMQFGFFSPLQSKIKELEEKLKDERDHRRMLQERALDVSSFFFFFFFFPFPSILFIGCCCFDTDWFREEMQHSTIFKEGTTDFRLCKKYSDWESKQKLSLPLPCLLPPPPHPQRDRAGDNSTMLKLGKGIFYNPL